MPEQAQAVATGRHRAVIVLLVVHVAVFTLLGWRAGWSAEHVLLEVCLPLIGLTVIARYAARPRLAMGAGALGLMYASAVLIHLTGGVTEAHFYFFVAFGLVALYRDWIVFFAAAAFAVGHHVVFALTNGVLFEQPYQLSSPLFWAAVHISFVTVVTAVQAVGMHDAGRSVASRTALEKTVEREAERRRTALTLHDDVVQALATARYASSLGEEQTSAAALERAMSASRALVTELLAGHPLDHRVLVRPEAPAAAG